MLFPFLVLSLTVLTLIVLIQLAFIAANVSSPLSKVASSDNRDTAVMHMVAEVIRAVLRPHLSTTTNESIVLNTFTIPSATDAVVCATSENRKELVAVQRR